MSVVLYDGNDVTFGRCTNPVGTLEDGKTYEIESIDVHNWHTRIKLRGVQGEFNSANFINADGAIDAAIEAAR